MKILTQDEFLSKHQSKYDHEGLTKAERRKRFESYASTLGGQHGANAGGPATRSLTRSSNAREPILRRATTGSTAESMKQRYAEVVMKSPLLRAMLDPFDLTWNAGDVPRVPDGDFTETSTLRLRDERRVTTDINGGFAVFVRATPFAAISTSNQASVVTSGDISYQAGMEYNAYAAYAERLSDANVSMPAWTENAWSVTVANPGMTVNPDFVQQDFPNADALYDVASAWRPVCLGVKLKPMNAPINASGTIAVARWQGTQKAPTISNQLLSLQVHSQTIPDQYGSGGPTFESVQNLPGAEIVPAPQGLTTVWAPDSLSAQRRWRATKPNPINGTDPAGLLGLFQVSDTHDTLEFVLPPPVTGDPERMQALVDRLYTQNNSVYAPQGDNGGGINGIPPGAAGVYTTLAGEQSVAGGMPTRAVFEQDTALALQTRMHDLYTTDMVDGDVGLIIIGVGLPASTEVFTVETVLGVEYIPDTRAIKFGGSGRDFIKVQKGAQDNEHTRAVLLSRESPTAVAGNGDAGSFVDKAIQGLDSAASTISTLAGGAERFVTTAAPILESILAMF